MPRIRLLVAALAAILLGALPIAASAAVPRGFVGMNVDGPAVDGRVDLATQLDSMVTSGVQSVRVAFSWAQAQPTRGGPISFASTDEIVGLAASRHLTVLPVAIYAPGWDQRPNPGGIASPSDPAPYANFVRQLVLRYGPGGSFWRASHIRPVPIRMWQIWNEPDLRFYWPQQPFAASYVALLRAASHAIKRVDRGAKVVLAGMPNYAWTDLQRIYRVPGARSLFDLVAVHPFTSEPRNVIVFLRNVRAVMDKNGDAAKPMLATEVSWPSSLGKAGSGGLFGFETTEAGQARNLAQVIPMLASDRRALGLAGFDQYTWIGDEFPGAGSFNYAGLLALRAGKVVTKPAFQAFRHAALSIEGRA